VIPLQDDIPAHRPPVVTVAIIAACVLVFLWQAGLGPQGMQRAIYRFGMIPAVLLGEARLPRELAVLPPAATLVSSMFLHGSWAHLFGNMLYLWIFGNNVEDRLGHVRFALFYLGCGLAAAAAQILPAPDSTIPMVGASGAISGVLGAYLVLFPHARVLVLIPFSVLFVHQIRASWMLGFWIIIQLVSALLQPAEAGGVAWWAHVGGFVGGAALVVVMRRRGIPLFDRNAPEAG
jgi:membrane associated rhomboid family serine protease